MGSGKAVFGSMIHYLTKQDLIVVDMDGFRHKEDNRINPTQSKRIQIGIQHLNLNIMDELKKYSYIYVVSKHLCGGATDFCLRAVISSLEYLPIKNIVIALCCRGKCSYETYCNIQMFEKFGFNQQEWELIRQLSSWAVDGSADDEHSKIGHICRNLIDEGRIQFLEQHGFNVQMIEYVDEKITKENELMIASLK